MSHERIQSKRKVWQLSKHPALIHLMFRFTLFRFSGKGYLDTYWLDTAIVASERKSLERSASSFSALSDSRQSSSRAQSNQRLIEWSVTSLVSLMKKIIVHRQGVVEHNLDCNLLENFRLQEGRTFFDEVAEIIELPPPNGVNIEKADLDDVEIGRDVIEELRELVRRIADMYNDNPFHNFEHANHVTSTSQTNFLCCVHSLSTAVSITKLLARILKPSDQEDDKTNTSYGITSDPLTQWACCFSSLIHDAVCHSCDLLTNPRLTNTPLFVRTIQVYSTRSLVRRNLLWANGTIIEVWQSRIRWSCA